MCNRRERPNARHFFQTTRILRLLRSSFWSIDQKLATHRFTHYSTQLLRHLRDFEAFLGTVAARLGACGHVLVIWHCFAGSGAILTALCTAQRGMGREIALPSAQRSRTSCNILRSPRTDACTWHAPSSHQRRVTRSDGSSHRIALGNLRRSRRTSSTPSLSGRFGISA